MESDSKVLRSAKAASAAATNSKPLSNAGKLPSLLFSGPDSRQYSFGAWCSS